MTTFNVNPLSRKSIDNTLLKLKNYKESLKSFPKAYADAIEQKLNEILDGQAPPMAKGLWSSYVVVKDGGGFGGDSEFGESGGGVRAEAIFTFEGRVEFIEFGTGVVGKKYHDGINTDWLSKLPGPYTEYNMGPTIVHFADEDMDYWVYKDEQGIHRTHGIAADPFIYRSVKELMRMHAELARDVFKRNNIGNDVEIWG